MPNYIKNRITVKDNAGEVFAFLKGDESAIDFMQKEKSILWH